jgi:hypothetical protein
LRFQNLLWGDEVFCFLLGVSPYLSKLLIKVQTRSLPLDDTLLPRHQFVLWNHSNRYTR